MPSPNEAFAINLDSLTTFSHELATQLSGMAQPKGHLDALIAGAMKLGAFGEAHSLRTNHDVAADEMSVLVGQARDAIDFAAEITKSVTRSYEHYDDEVAAAMNNVGSGNLGTSLGNTVGNVGNAVGAIGSGIGNGINAGIGLGAGTVDAIVDGLIGDDDGQGGLPGELPDDLTGDGLSGDGLSEDVQDGVVEDIVDAIIGAEQGQTPDGKV
jgi:hypothetical protein